MPPGGRDRRHAIATERTERIEDHRDVDHLLKDGARDRRKEAKHAGPDSSGPAGTRYGAASGRRWAAGLAEHAVAVGAPREAAKTAGM